ncbi:MAG TPA: HepT-like ribonuclease domain-containing protein [Anaerolineales bacterium]|nr:HepT-like ribonuclease domain-containing protein [Anaerolineales bacterium]
MDAIEAIETYSVSSYDEFLEDAKTQDAILYNLIIIGEAANQISEEFQERHNTIPWSSMIGTRNIIVHGYDQVKLQIVWKILQRDLESLKSEVVKALE